METKRSIFPRFCFVSDPTLLEILGQAADCHTIQKYLDGFFDNIGKVIPLPSLKACYAPLFRLNHNSDYFHLQLEFSEKEYEKIIAMYSREDEKVDLEKEVICTGGVENWLNVLLSVHQLSVGSVIAQGVQTMASEEFDLIQLIDNSILQVISTSHLVSDWLLTTRCWLLFSRWVYWPCKFCGPVTPK